MLNVRLTVFACALLSFSCSAAGYHSPVLQRYFNGTHGSKELPQLLSDPPQGVPCPSGWTTVKADEPCAYRMPRTREMMVPAYCGGIVGAHDFIARNIHFGVLKAVAFSYISAFLLAAHFGARQTDEPRVPPCPFMCPGLGIALLQLGPVVFNGWIATLLGVGDALWWVVDDVRVLFLRGDETLWGILPSYKDANGVGLSLD